jgi:hypothetical protein
LLPNDGYKHVSGTITLAIYVHPFSYPAILEYGTEVDGAHHHPLAFLNTSTLQLEPLEEVHKGAREIVELDIGEQHPMK